MLTIKQAHTYINCTFAADLRGYIVYRNNQSHRAIKKIVN
jgi:hypothetical protein